MTRLDWLQQYSRGNAHFLYMSYELPNLHDGLGFMMKYRGYLHTHALPFTLLPIITVMLERLTVVKKGLQRQLNIALTSISSLRKFQRQARKRFISI